MPPVSFIAGVSVGVALIFGLIFAYLSKRKGESAAGAGCLMVIVAAFVACELLLLGTCSVIHDIADDYDDYHYGIWQGDEGRRREREDRYRREQQERERTEQANGDAAGLIADKRQMTSTGGRGQG